MTERPKPVLVMVTEALRRENHVPLRYFKHLKIVHLYERAPYGDLTAADLNGGIQFASPGDLRRRLIELAPDVIQGPEPYGSRKMLRYAWEVLQVVKETRAKLIIPVLENRPVMKRFGWLKGWFVRQFFRIYARQASLLFAYNNGAVRNLRDVGVPEDTIIRLPWGVWGVDTNEFAPTPRRQDPPRNLGPEPIVLFAGRLVEEKGVWDLLEAWRQLVASGQAGTLVLAGRGPLETELKQFARSHHLVKRVQFVGMIKSRDLPRYYRQAAVAVAPSLTLSWWEEQLGMVNLQAMASGVPVVSTTSGAIPEVVPDEKAGLLVPERAPAALAAAIDRILGDSKLARRLGEAGRRHVLDHYRETDIIRRAEALILTRVLGEVPR